MTVHPIAAMGATNTHPGANRESSARVAQQAAILTALDCDTIQGYLFGHPVSAAHFLFEPRAKIRLAA